MESLIIRVDASAQIGTGHLMRCLALAQAWKDGGGEVTFITACHDEGLLQRLRDEEFDVKLLPSAYPDTADWNFTRDILTGHPGARVVLDGYHFDEVYQRQVKEAGYRLLVIDDMAHLKHYYADILLNQNLGAEQFDYSCESYTRLLLGTCYVLLRREFLSWKNWKREIPEVAWRILVTMGGSDSENHTLKVVQILQKVDMPALEVTVVIGASNPHADELEAAARQSRIPIRLISNEKNMPELMAWADVAISAGGSTVWELVYMGLPIMVVVLASNQEAIARSLQERGGGYSFSREQVQRLLLNRTMRMTINQNRKSIIDGCGAKRLMTILRDEK